jgi:hypothetical protein
MPRRATVRSKGSRRGRSEVHLAWQSLVEPGLEIVTLARDDDRLVADGRALRFSRGVAHAINWRIECDRDWRTRAATVWPTGGNEPLVATECNGRGLWTVRQGRTRDRIAGCVDVALAGGPYSHTLPIRRLELDVPGQEVRVRVALVDPVKRTLAPAHRSYTLLESLVAGRLFRYRDLDAGTTAELVVDDFGLVQDHPGQFRMVWCA